MEAADGILKAVAPDEPHGVVGPAVRIGAQTVDWDDARMLQSARDLGLQQEAGPAIGVVGVPVLNLFEGDLPTSPKRPTGIRSGRARGLPVTISVSTRAGAMALTVMPSFASRAA
jgi:hypothetical protein